jgi:glycosyltransferase involved in cell wall biosynthesis
VRAGRAVSAAPAVTVLMPVRDGARFLDEALDSVFAQTFEDFELLVVDDGSTDSTPDLLARRQDPRLRVVPAAGRGLVAALQQGLTATHRPYVARMDADDVSEPQRLERQVGIAQERPRAALVGSWVTVIDESGRTLRSDVLPTRHTDLARRLLLRNSFAHGSVLLRREAIEDVGGYRDDYGANEDYDLWRRLARSWELACVPEPLYRYRVHGAAVTQTDPARVALRERLRDEIWRDTPRLIDVRDTVRSGRIYRSLDPAVYRDHVADQRALAREALRRRKPLLAAHSVAISLGLWSTGYSVRQKSRSR